jgi:hypothetical protein
MSEEMGKKEALFTGLVDLTEWSLSDLRYADTEVDVSRVLKQIEKPRTNLGGGAPPGRAD